MFGGNDITCNDDGEHAWAEIQDPSYEVSGDMRDLAETIKDLVPGIDGEALSDELIRLSEEVQCMEENPNMFYMADADQHTLTVLKNRKSMGSIAWLDDEGNEV